jgi:hypothetical protein
MALQGNLRDFSAMEILQLVGTQKKAGCLVMEWNTERVPVWVVDGRIVSTRDPGLSKDDPLARFLRQVNRLSDEQFRGLLIIQKESGRDFEDLVVNGRYIEAEELAPFVERQILDDLMRLVRWENGTYRFDPAARWPGEPVVSLSMEAGLIEAARRVDEQKRFVSVFRDPHQLLTVHDLPDPDEPLSEEERELFGLVDGLRTVAEVVAAAPLTEFEAYEALHRMLEARWIEFSGRRDPGIVTPVTPVAPPRQAAGAVPAWVREAAVALAVIGIVALVRAFASQVSVGPRPDPERDVYAHARVRDLRLAVDLFARERGAFPRRLEELVDDRWIEPGELRIPGYEFEYRIADGGREFVLTVVPAR